MSPTAVNLLKKAPVTDIVLIGTLGLVFGRAFGEMNLIVTATLVSRLMMDERDTETDVATPENTAGIVTPDSVSKAPPLMSKVDMTMSDFAAEAYEGRMTPRIVHSIAELEGGNPEPSIEILKNGLP